MQKLGADRYEEKDNYVLFPTICHNIDSSEASMKLYFYKDTKLFVCYTECGNMSIFKFLRHYYENRQIEYDWYEDIYNAVLNCSTFNPRKGFSQPVYQSLKDRYIVREHKELEVYSSNVLDCFVKRYPIEWINDGISKEAMDKFNILYSISQNKIIIPHYDINNNLVGIRGRALNEWEVENFGKYMPIQIEGVWYKHPLSLNLYGLNKNADNIRHSGICFIFESEKSVLQCESFSGRQMAVAACGSNFNIYQLKLLMKTCMPQEIILCFDNEEKPKEDRYFNKLYSIANKYKDYCNFSFVYDRERLTKPKDSPSDCGQEIFERLLNRRVIVR